MKTPILTDAEIEACVRMKYKGKSVSIEIINHDVQDLKQMRDEKGRETNNALTINMQNEK